MMRALLSATSHSPVAEAEYAGSSVAQKNSPTSQATHLIVIGLHRLMLDLNRRTVRRIRFGIISHECFAQARGWIDHQFS
jgi:hypothetical protein